MTECEIALDLVNTFKEAKEEDPETIAFGENLNNSIYKNCDFEILEHLLKKLNFNMKIEIMDGHKFVVVSPIE